MNHTPDLPAPSGSPFDLNERTGEMTLPDPTVRITAKGLAKLHLLLGGSGSFGVLAVKA